VKVGEKEKVRCVEQHPARRALAVVQEAIAAVTPFRRRIGFGSLAQTLHSTERKVAHGPNIQGWPCHAT
jgi:hypothetical protein